MKLESLLWFSNWQLLFLFILLGLHPVFSQAQEQSPLGGAPAQLQKGNPPDYASNSPSFKRFHKVLGKNLTSNLFHQGNLMPLLLGATGALAIHPWDHSISNELKPQYTAVGEAGNVLGGPYLVYGLTGGLAIAGALSSQNHFRSFSYTFVQAIVVDNILTQGLKVAVQRTRPDGDSYSFPSGHASNSFAGATVVNHFYGKKWGIAAFGLAGLVGYSRVEKGRHWPSDVVAGAALGYISGITAIRGTRREMESGFFKHATILPMWNRQGRGLQVRFTL